MGCASSKSSVGATLDVYRPAPSSFAVFDINTIEEPWLKNETNSTNYKPPTSHVPAPILEKLHDDETSEPTPPSTWEEISKALEEVKIQPPPQSQSPSKKEKNEEEEEEEEDEYNWTTHRRTPRKSASFHTLEELETRLNPSSSSTRTKTNTTKTTTNKQQQQLMLLPPPTPTSASASTTSNHLHLRKTVSSSSLKPSSSNTTITTNPAPPVVFGGTDSTTGFRSVKDNPFIIMDMTTPKGATSNWVVRRDPFLDYPEICPPNGSQSVVIYTTSLRGVRKTFEDCTRAKTVLEVQRVVFDERDVSLHAEFLTEVKNLLVDELEGGGVSVPRIFIHGRYVGGADHLVELNESGRLGRMLTWAKVERGVGWQGCEGCGGARFVPCLECGGSCKVVVDGEKEKGRCTKCNENGLLHCPLCH